MSRKKYNVGIKYSICDPIADANYCLLRTTLLYES